jgi:flagellar hook-associated protein 2
LVSPGLHSIAVTKLAQAQRSVTAGFDNITASLNGGQAFSLTIRIGPTGSQTAHTIAIPQESTNLSAVANAINNEAIGVSAQVLDTGDTSNNGANRYRLVLTGQTGESKQFSMTTTGADGDPLALTTGVGQEASDAAFTVNGVALTRSSNTIADVIPGATLDLLSTTSSAATLQFTRDSSGVKDKMKALVKAYNDLVSDLKILTGPKSDDEADGEPEPDADGETDALVVSDGLPVKERVARGDAQLASVGRCQGHSCHRGSQAAAPS